MSSGSMSMSEQFLNLIFKKLDKTKTILEFGSGDGTKKLVDHGYTVYSIEENEKYCGLHHDNYLLAEIVDDWYDEKKVFDFIKNKNWDALLIDGPAHGDRKKMFEILGSDFFMKTPIIFIDDIERPNDRELFYMLREGRKYEDFENYGVIM